MPPRRTPFFAFTGLLIAISLPTMGWDRFDSPTTESVRMPGEGVAQVVESVAVSSFGPAARSSAAAPIASIAAEVKALMPANAHGYIPFIETAAARHGVPVNVLTGALARESANFNEKYVRGYHVDGTGRGIAGIDKFYHPEVSDEQSLDPEFSINWMARELGGLISKHRGDVYSAVREYNGGENFASNRIGYAGTPVAVLTQRHAQAIFAYAAGR